MMNVLVRETPLEISYLQMADAGYSVQCKLVLIY